MSILYRDHKGSLDESMATVQEFKDMGSLRNYLKAHWESWGLKLEEIRFNYCCFDDRIDWDTYYVLVRFKDKPNFIVAGMSNGKDLPEIYLEKEIYLN